MLEGVAVVWMPVQDIERAKGFYRDTLDTTETNPQRLQEYASILRQLWRMLAP
jgi:predicted enzyme related to lactoylglutathione lyase